MMGYVDAIISRQDANHEIKNMESFHVETASRRTMKELVRFFSEELERLRKHQNKVEEAGENNHEKILRHAQLITKLQEKVKELPLITKKLQKLNMLVE